MHESPVAARRRRWPLFLPFGLMVLLAILWSGAWYYVAARAQDAIADWRAREARSGRAYDCGAQTMAGFPFRIEVRCAAASAELPVMAPPLALKMDDALFAWQIYQPGLVIAEFAGPLTLDETGAPASLVARLRAPSASRSWPRRRASLAARREAISRCSRRSISSCMAAAPRAQGLPPSIWRCG